MSAQAAEERRIKEKIEVLAGDRGDEAKSQRAVRYADLTALYGRAQSVTLADIGSTDAAGGTPTQAEFDALRADVVSLRLSVAALLSALRDVQ